MALFLSTYTNKIDKKGRVSVPAPFRAALTEDEGFSGIVVFSSFRYPALEACDRARMRHLARRHATVPEFSDDYEDLAFNLFSSSHELSFDADGRVILPADVRQEIGVDTHVCFAGRGETFQLWSPDTFREHQQQARARAAERRLTLPPLPEA